MFLARAGLAVLALGGVAQADVPNVVTDIAPVHSLVMQVMDGVGTAELLVPPNVSPHGFALRPSQARALDQADLVIWIGPELTPWLDESVDALASQAEAVELSEVGGTVRLGFRDMPVFALGKEHGHDDHDDHSHDADAHTEHDHKDHADDAHGHEEHAHDGMDMHMWLDPRNAAIWVPAIAEALAAQDPDNAGTYRANAQTAVAQLGALEGDLRAKLAPVQDSAFLVYHDAYQYFENRFGLRVTGAISASDADKPGPARLAELREAVREAGVVCVFHEPQYSPRLVQALELDSEISVAELDPIGADIALGKGHYAALLTDLATRLAACLGRKAD